MFSIKTKIIQLSDLHFSDKIETASVDDKSEILRPEDSINYTNKALFKDYLKKIALDEYANKCILVTGDLTNKGNIKGLEFASNFLKECAQILKIPTCNIIVTPGNHDIIRCEDSQKQWEDFKTYTKDFCTPFSKNTYYEIKDKLLLYPLNSMRLSKVPSSDYKFNFVDRILKREQYKMEETPIVDEGQFNSLEDAVVSSNALIRIAALHHHVIPVYGIEAKSFEIIMNAGNLMRMLQREGFSLILHGHKHGQSVRFIQDKELVSSPVGMHVIGVRSFSEKNAWFNEIDVNFDDTNSILPKIYYNGYFFEGGISKQAGSTIDCSPANCVNTKKNIVTIAVELGGDK